MTRKGVEVLNEASWESWRNVKRERRVSLACRGDEAPVGDDGDMMQ